MISTLKGITCFCLILTLISIMSFAGEFPKTIRVFKGTTPVLDGIISTGEYSDATAFYGSASWTHEQNIPTDSSELSLIGLVKHDGTNLYFSFDVTDNIIYGYDIPRWLPDENSGANQINASGYPWFGDAIELMINASNSWDSNSSGPSGDGTSWQMVCNTHKSRLDSLKKGGLMEGEPRNIPAVYARYTSWIINGSMQAFVRIKNPDTEGHGYVIEWMIKPNPCLEIQPGVFWNGDMPRVEMGLNFELEDLDAKETGAGKFANFNHIEYWAAPIGFKNYLKQWGKMIIYNTLITDPVIDPVAGVEQPLASNDIAIKNYPNPMKEHTTFEFYTKAPSKVNLAVYDSFGKKIDMPISNELSNIGTNSVMWFPKTLSSGIYFYRFESNGLNTVRKLIIE